MDAEIANPPKNSEDSGTSAPAAFAPAAGLEAAVANECVSRLVREVYRAQILGGGESGGGGGGAEAGAALRCDGRSLTALRPISCAVDLYRPLHGSAVFQRGQTQVLCTLTLDSPDTAARLDPVAVFLTYLLHFYVPTFLEPQLHWNLSFCF